ncbi:MAG: extracellular solute-binding protein [Oscillospiraceae bacterium]|nr:extracellular solute-binding protein [Oscillospiraceae bacterium]
MYCRKCQTVLQDNAAFCTRCGNKVYRCKVCGNPIDAPAANASPATAEGLCQECYASRNVPAAVPVAVPVAAPQNAPKKAPKKAPNDKPKKSRGMLYVCIALVLVIVALVGYILYTNFIDAPSDSSHDDDSDKKTTTRQTDPEEPQGDTGLIEENEPETTLPTNLDVEAAVTEPTEIVTEAPRPEEHEPVTLRFWQAGGDTVDASTTMRLLLDKFELMYPWITVDYQAIPWSMDPHTQFQISIARGDCADLLVLGSPLDFQLAGEGIFLDLECLLNDEILDDIPQVLLENCYYYGINDDFYGSIMSLPLYTGNRALMYNKEIFDYFGVDYPTEGMSHADLLEMAKAVTGNMNGTYVYGYGTRATTSEQYLNFVWNYGGQIVDPYTLTAGTASTAWKKGIQDYMAFYEAGTTPEGAASMNGSDLFSMFANGECAMFIAAVDYANALVADGWTEEKLGIAPPVGETYATCYAGADVLAVPATTEHAEEVALLLNYLLSPDAQINYCMTIGFLPTTYTALYSDRIQSNFVLAGFADAMSGAHYFDNYGVPGVGTILKQEIQQLINGYITIDQYQANITQRINEKASELY